MWAVAEVHFQPCTIWLFLYALHWKAFIFIMMSLTSILSVLPFLLSFSFACLLICWHLNLDTTFFFMEFKKSLAVSGLHCGTQALSLRCTDSLVVAHKLSSYGTWAQLHRGMWDLSSLAWDWTLVLCVARQILNHWTTREVPATMFLPKTWKSLKQLLNLSLTSLFLFIVIIISYSN